MIISSLVLYLSITVTATPQKKLSNDEVRWYQEKFAGISPEQAKEEVSLVNTFSTEAKKLKLDKKKRTELELKYILSQAFIETKYQEFGWDINKIPSESQLKNYYESFPLIKINHLVVSTEEKAQQVSNELLDTQKKFPDLVKAHSEDEVSKTLGGLIEDLGKHNFHINFYLPLIKLNPMETVGPIKMENHFHFFQLLSKTQYPDANGPYLAYLRQEFQNNQKKEWERKLLVEIRNRKSNSR